MGRNRDDGLQEDNEFRSQEFSRNTMLNSLSKRLQNFLVAGDQIIQTQSRQDNAQGDAEVQKGVRILRLFINSLFAIVATTCTQ